MPQKNNIAIMRKETSMTQQKRDLTLQEILKMDMYRYSGARTFAEMAKTYLTEPGANYVVWFRIAQKFNNTPFRHIAMFLLRRKMYRYGIEIYPMTQIKPGFYIGHFSGVIISPYVKIGKNFNISQGVTIGQGKGGGFPTVGDNVFVGPGAKIFGDIHIGNNVAIGANAVVTKSVPDNAVVVGIPAKIISENGSGEYVEYKV